MNKEDEQKQQLIRACDYAQDLGCLWAIHNDKTIGNVGCQVGFGEICKRKEKRAEAEKKLKHLYEEKITEDKESEYAIIKNETVLKNICLYTNKHCLRKRYSTNGIPYCDNSSCGKCENDYQSKDKINIQTGNIFEGEKRIRVDSHTGRVIDSPEPPSDGLKEKAIKGYKLDDGKPMWGLLPPDAMDELVKVYTFGTKKYAPHNWLKGMDWCRVFAALCRHAFAWLSGESYDKETGLHHMAHAAWNAMTLVTYEKKGIGKDDRWKDPRQEIKKEY